jgi:hypothetical protein
MKKGLSFFPGLAQKEKESKTQIMLFFKIGPFPIWRSK